MNEKRNKKKTSSGQKAEEDYKTPIIEGVRELQHKLNKAGLLSDESRSQETAPTMSTKLDEAHVAAEEANYQRSGEQPPTMNTEYMCKICGGPENQRPQVVISRLVEFVYVGPDVNSDRLSGDLQRLGQLVREDRAENQRVNRFMGPTNLDPR